MTSANTARKTAILPRDPAAPVNRLISIKDVQNPSDLVEQSTERYLTTIRRSMPEFTVAEWCLIFDALRPPWQADEWHTAQISHEIADAIAIDQLDNKWPVDAANLKGRMNRLTFAARMAVGEMVETFWAQPVQGNYNQVITTLLETLGPPPKGAAGHGRSNRMVLDRMGLENETGLQDTPGAGNAYEPELGPDPEPDTPSETETGPEPTDEDPHAGASTDPAPNGLRQSMLAKT